MDQIEIIKQRIANRRQNWLYSDEKLVSKEEQEPQLPVIKKEKKRKERRRKRPMLSVATALMFLLSLALGSIVYIRVDEKGKLLSYFNINADFSSVNKQIGGFLDNVLNYDLFNGGEKVTTVNKINIYQQIAADLYSTGSNEVKAIDNGTVVSAQYINQIPTIIIQHDSGFVATYTNMIDFLVMKMDRVYAGNSIGVADDTVSIYFSQNGVKLTYEEVCLLLN